MLTSCEKMPLIIRAGMIAINNTAMLTSKYNMMRNGENGLIADRKNSETLADNIEILLDSEDMRHKMGEDGYRKFKEKFTLKAFEQKFVECMHKIGIGGVTRNLVFRSEEHTSELQSRI